MAALYGGTVLEVKSSPPPNAPQYRASQIHPGARSRLHPLLVFFSVLGGIRGFGILGIVAGLLIVAIGRAMLDIYRLEQTGTLASPPAAKR